ncbi:MAG: hypothetical protein R8M46_05185 [Ghiorsea sp.]
MQRFTALITLAAFLLVITLPMIPVPPACAHSAMGNDEACETACHGESATLAPDDMDMAELDMEMEVVVEQAQVISQQEVSTEKPPFCRIECGCGCNSSPDEFPLVLTPHLPSHPMTLITPIPSEYVFHVVATKAQRDIPPDSPPPRQS